ncbi:MAG: TatD family hydrolase [Chloroflexota bacterium]|nr:TatD family hydrolase [Chloroflexota bacterium]
MNDARAGLFVDTHAHLDDPVFDEDRDGVLLRAEQAGVRRIVNVGYNPERWASTIQLATSYPAVAVVLGLHPQEARLFETRLLDDLTAAVVRSGACALGEIGFDFYRDGPDRAAQRTAFRAQLELAAELSLPVVIHQRAAEEDLIDALRSAPDLPGVLLHSFDGSARLARFAAERGYAVGIGGLATRPSASALRDVLASLPLASLVLETDSPYLVPTGARHGRNEPANVALVAERLAPLWGVSAEELAAATSERAKLFFGLNG